MYFFTPQQGYYRKVLGFSFLGLGVSIPKGLGDSTILGGGRGEMQAEVIGKSRVDQKL